MTIRITKRVAKQIKRRHFKVRNKVSKQRTKNLIRSFSYLGILLVASFSFFFIYNIIASSELFRVKRINVYGLSSIDSVEFNQKLNDQFGNMVLFKAGSIKSHISSIFPEIKSIKLKYSMPGTISFYITERQPIAQLVYGGDNYFVDEENKLFKLNKSSTIDVPEININFDSDASREAVIRFVSFLKKDYDWFYQKVKTISIQEKDTVIVTHSNLKIFWGNQYYKASIKDKINVLNKVINYKPKEYVDLRYSDYSRVIVK